MAMWISGQTVNLMTLGGLALAVGILVDEGTVVIENVHSHLGYRKNLSQASYDGTNETLVPNFLAMCGRCCRRNCRMCASASRAMT